MTMRLFAPLCVFFAAVILTFPAASQQRNNQVALIIGNANYPDSGTPLPTTIKDARALADEFRRNNFDVDVKENVSKEDMQRAIDAFTGKIRSGTVALFYFSGHGIQVARQTYLIPVNAQVWSEDDTKRDGISLDAIVADMHRKGARVKIIIIDASRRNPFERRFRASAAGIAALDAPQNSLAIYSAAPGTVVNDGTGDNSLFVSELIRELRVPNLTAEEAFNHTRVGVSRASGNEQIPWVASSMIEDFSFGPNARIAATTTPTTPPAPAIVPPVSADPCGGGAATVSQSPRAACSLSATAERAIKPKDSFKECDRCPEMVVVPAGTFTMGSPESERTPVAAAYATYGIVIGSLTTAPPLSSEGPQHQVTIARPIAVGRFAVTFDEWDACADDGGCNGYRPSDQGWGRGSRPVVNINWDDANGYVAWLSHKTGKGYRLLSEAEREYVTRAGTNTPYWWGSSFSTNQANYNGNRTYGDQPTGENRQTTLPVKTFLPNPWGLYQVHGNTYDWVADCFHDDYYGAPLDGSAWITEKCKGHVVRGGAWTSAPWILRSAFRGWFPTNSRVANLGFRLARTLGP